MMVMPTVMMVMVPAVMMVPHMMMVVMAAHMVMMVTTMAHLHDRVRWAHSVGQRRGCGCWAGKTEAGQHGQGE